ncbi:AMP-binding protein [Halomonas sp. DP5Y7-2]|uniref:AMP-binding protein n=1 Tax=Halomonas sp. DP5Y7-2 TaxID=2859076 RepID=UPI001C995184|nr:AMP-binding protein [Halomonas sp. DP5Y7-2]MBY5985931.1 AMP-binding protein [Halomonas sp. DP5Y7-2]
MTPFSTHAGSDYLGLTQRPWRQPVQSNGALTDAWCHAQTLGPSIDAWRTWLEPRPKGRWLLFATDPGTFTAALLALWESGQSALLPGDDRPATLERLLPLVVGRIPAAPTATPTATPTVAGTQDNTAATSRVTLSSTDAGLPLEGEAVVLCTSGSTGQPSLAAKSFRQLDEELSRHASLWPLTGRAVISQVSHQHIYGLLTGILSPLCHNVPFCGNDSRYPEVMAQRASESSHIGLTNRLVTSPAQLSRLPQHLALEHQRITDVFSSGAPLALADATRCEQLLNAPVIEIYGSTETGGIAYRQQSRQDAWRPFPDIELDLGDSTLRLRSPFLPHPDQWWEQADRVERDGEGFRLLGRRDRLAKVGGKRISLTALEQRLCELQHVDDARCVDLDLRDGRLGVVVAMAGDALPQEHEPRRRLIASLREHLGAALEPSAMPRYWRFVEALPLNPQGKHDQAALRRFFDDLTDDRQPRWLGAQGQNTQWHLTLEVPERLRYLEGHFEGFPLVPGVVLVQWAIQHAREVFSDLGRFRGVDRLKFQKVVRPGQRLTLSLQRRADGIGFTYDSAQGRHASGRVRLEARDE